MFEMIASDVRRKRQNYVRIENFVNKYLKVTFQLGTLAVFVYRMGAWLHCQNNSLVRFVGLIVYGFVSYFSSLITGVYISPATPIGSGIVVHNFSNVSIDAESIGENLTVNQGVYVGSDWRANGKPKLGDNVFVGSGAKILGDVTIGNNVIVAANALVERSIPDNCTVVGVPARIVSRNSNSQYLKFNEKGSAKE